MSNINLRQLEAFRAVMMTRSITRASELLYVSQPAVSRLISDLESKVGFPLFQRIKKRLNPTPEAHAFYEEVERSFTGLHSTTRAPRDNIIFEAGTCMGGMGRRRALLASQSARRDLKIPGDLSVINRLVYVEGPDEVIDEIASSVNNLGPQTRVAIDRP